VTDRDDRLEVVGERAQGTALFGFERDHGVRV
jgi:hypothetical protein